MPPTRGGAIPNARCQPPHASTHTPICPLASASARRHSFAAKPNLGCKLRCTCWGWLPHTSQHAFCTHPRSACVSGINSPSILITPAATQPTYHLAPGLTLVRTSGRACSRTPSQIAQRCWIQAKMVQIRVAFTPEMGREGAVAPRIVRSFFFVLTKPRQGIRRTNFC